MLERWYGNPGQRTGGKGFSKLYRIRFRWSLQTSIWLCHRGRPPQEDGVLVIVSALVMQASDRTDLVAPATGHPDCVRDEAGRIKSVPGFVRKA